jgi:hypothetical protein
MDTALHSTFKQPNAYVWPQEGEDNLMTVDSEVFEMRIQISALNKRLDKLTRTLQAMVDKEKQDNLLYLLSEK